MKKPNLHLPARSFSRILGLSILLLLFYLIAISPFQKNLQRYDREIRKVEARIDEQNILTPIHETLKEKLNTKGSEILATPDEENFNIERIDDIGEIFGTIARQSNLTPVHFIPDPKSIPRDFSLLLVDGCLQGDFLDFRQFLIKLGEVGYLKKLEEVQVKSGADAKEFRIKLWLTLNRDV